MPDFNRKSLVTLAVSSGKGGVGKSNVSVNLAAALGNAGHRVLLMDADLGLANIDLLLGCRAEMTLEHVVRGEATLDEIVLNGPKGVKFIPAASGIEEMANLGSVSQSNLIHDFGNLGLDPDFFIVDVAAGIHSSVVNFCLATQHVIVVVCDEPTSLADAYGLIKVLSTKGVRKFTMLSSMVKNEQAGYALYQKMLRATDRFLSVGVSYLGMVPFDENLRRAVRRQASVVHAYPQSQSARYFRQAADKIARLSSPEGASGRLEFFMERLLKPNSFVEAV
ncbi:MAG: MinD/ParA family protein [Pseudomonadales bacterium]|nr:MinD/ParA family protein [Pseudomonadales bacterium]